MSPRNRKRCRMSTDSMSEPPSSAVSYCSYTNGYLTSATSATSHSQHSSMEFPFSSYSSRHSQREKKFAKPFASGIRAILLHKKSVIDNLTVDSGLVKADANAMTVMLRMMHPTHQNQQMHNLPLKAVRMQTKRKRNTMDPNSNPHQNPPRRLFWKANCHSKVGCLSYCCVKFLTTLFFSFIRLPWVHQPLGCPQLICACQRASRSSQSSCCCIV
jgi:hypothetical protein